MRLLAGQILAIIWISINTLLIGPYVTYQSLQFYKHKTKPFIFNRKPSMVISFCIAALVTLICIMPLCYGFEIFTQKSEGTQHYGYIIILYSITATFLVGFWRAWHVWFDAKYKMEAATNTWAKHLNHSERDTFRRYKDTLGNSNWTKKCLLFIAVLLISISTLVIVWKHFVIIEGIVCSTLFLTFIGLVFVIRRLSSVKDEIMLRTEYIYFAYFGCLYGVCYIVLYVISHDWNEPDPTNIEVLYDALYLIIPSPILYCLILVQTQWVLYQYKEREREQNRSVIDIHSSGQDDTPTMDANLKDILRDFEGFRCFMEYLVKCLSAENLLYVSEAIQFMRYLTDTYAVTASTIQLRAYVEQFPIPDILPNSYIMSQIDATSIRFLRLCEKYILVQSEFEINISHRNRKNIIRIYKMLEDKINEMNPKISKLSSIFGSESQFRASRRASQTNFEDSDTFNEQSSYNKRKGLHVPQTSHNKILHECLEDIQLLSNTEDLIQNMYDALSSTLGDVYSNLNDAGGRFRQTDIYRRWLETNFKKDQLLLVDGLEDDTSNDTEQETKPIKTQRDSH